VSHTYLNSYGVRLDVEVHDETLQPSVELILPPAWQRSQEFPEDGHFTLEGPADGAYSVLVDGAPIATGLTAEVAIHVLDAQLRLRIAALASDHVFVHAGVVALGERALLLPGPSLSGKSTLVAALVAEGAAYYSDEFAVLDGTGAVHPYPRRLSLRAEGEGSGTYTEVDALGGRPGEGLARPGVIAVTSYMPGEQWSPQRHRPAFGALSLLTNTVPANERPQDSMRAVSRAAADAVVLAGARGEARETAKSLMVELETVTGPPVR
jgi:hypothetical protein